MLYIIILALLAQVQTSHCAPLPKDALPVFFRLGSRADADPSPTLIQKSSPTTVEKPSFITIGQLQLVTGVTMLILLMSLVCCMQPAGGRRHSDVNYKTPPG